MMLPETVVGMIDLATLGDIHHCLNESALEDDLALAAWVKQYFLYEPTTSPGREIRTTEGFAQLDRAYRRVRSLTNKAQDKWPFFNEAWKEMSATDVRNNARGEAAPGVTLPGMINAVHESSMSNGQHAHTGYITPAPEPFVPFGVTKATRYNAQRCQRRQSFPNSVPNTPVPLPPTKQGQQSRRSGSEKQSYNQEQPKAQMRLQSDSATAPVASKSSTPEDATSSEIQPNIISSPAAEFGADAVKTQSEDSTNMSVDATATSHVFRSAISARPSTEDATLDPEGGKVRGINGRFMPKENSGRPKRSSNAKPVRKSKVIKKQPPLPEVYNVKRASPAPAALDDEAKLDAPLTPASIDEGKDDKNEDRATPNIVSDEIITAPVDVATAPETPFHTSKSGITPTPIFTLAAESEAVFSNLDRLPPGSSRNKKRKSNPTTQEGPKPKRARPSSSSPESKKKSQDSGSIAAAEEEEAPGMSTRRATRRSAAKVEETTPSRSAPKQPTLEKEEERTEDLEDKTIVDIKSPLALGLLKTISEEVSKPAPENPSEPTSVAKVEFFARVPTPTGMVEVPVLKDGLQKDLKIIDKYAEWMEKEGTEISFHAFKSIFGLAKKE